MSIQKDVSTKQEKEVAAKLGGKLVPASGGTKYDAGDVIASNFLIECKTTTQPKASFSIKRDWLDKIDEQAFEQGKQYAALAFRFDPDGGDYVVLDINTFNELLIQIQEKENE